MATVDVTHTETEHGVFDDTFVMQSSGITLTLDPHNIITNQLHDSVNFNHEQNDSLVLEGSQVKTLLGGVNTNLGGLTVNNLAAGDSITIHGYTITHASYSGGKVTITATTGSGSHLHTHTFTLSAPGATGSFTAVGGKLVYGPSVCFCSGARIRTTRGEVAVEDLQVGDLALTASNEARPIKWIGRRKVDAPAGTDRPVKVSAGAFGENRPGRDLFLSPGHAVCVKAMDEVFVPVGQLVNGATIAQIEMDEVTYWHVELESHDVLLAEGLPAESYMDAGNREWFGHEHGRLAGIDPDRATDSLSRYARPFVDRGPVVKAIRERLIARAEALGWSRDHDVGLHLLADGRRIEAQVDGDLARFFFPADTKTVVLVSNPFSPTWMGDNRDSRELGLLIKIIEVSDGLRVDRRIAPDHPALGDGFHNLERHGEEFRRWTDGCALLPPELWADCKDQVTLRLAFVPRAAWSWQDPGGAKRRNEVMRRAA